MASLFSSCPWGPPKHYPSLSVCPTKYIISGSSSIHICSVLIYVFSNRMLRVAPPVFHQGWVTIIFNSIWPKINASSLFHSFSSPPSLFFLKALKSQIWGSCFAHFHWITMRCSCAAAFPSSTCPQLIRCFHHFIPHFPVRLTYYHSVSITTLQLPAFLNPPITQPFTKFGLWGPVDLILSFPSFSF